MIFNENPGTTNWKVLKHQHHCTQPEFYFTELVLTKKQASALKWTHSCSA